MRPGTVDLSNIRFVTDEVAWQIGRYRIFTDDLYISVAGSLGIVGKVPKELDGANLTENADRITSISCSQDYLLHVLMSPLTQRAIDSSGTVGAQPKLALEKLRKFLIPLPPTVAEQERIALALNDVNSLIVGLDRLIAKKHDLKQGAMQQLLTGRTRLAGSNAEWPIARMGDLFRFSGGYSASRDQLSNDGYHYLHYGDIHGSSKTVIDVDSDAQDIPKLRISLRHISPDSLLSDGDIVFVDASEDDEGTSRHVVVSNKAGIFFIAGLHTIVAKAVTPGLDHKFCRYCFQTESVKRQFAFYAVGTKVSGISKTNIAKVAVPVPPSLEQAAIAEVLCAIDAEIAALVQRREKTHSVKRAMMQELLTGQIRLI